MWHCPSCGAPQAETARCWVCHRSSTTCSTCRHFRTSLSAEVGWCALDPKRLPLTGREQRGCWQERPIASEPATEQGQGRRPPFPVDETDTEPSAPAHLDFIPVELIGRLTTRIDADPKASPGSPEAADAPITSIAPILAEHDDGWAERTSLFGEPEA